MIAQEENFITGFVKQCFEAGLTQDETTILYDATVWRENLSDPDFAEGFAKKADDGLNPFSVLDPTAKGTVLGGIGGGALGALLTRGKNTARSLAAGGGIGAGLGAGLGALIGKGSKINRFLKDEWAPDYLVPGRATSVKPKQPNNGNAFSAIYGFKDTPRSEGIADTSKLVAPVAAGRRMQQQVASIDDQITSLESGIQAGKGLSGALANRRLQSQINALKDQRSQLMQDIGSSYNSVRRDQAISSRSIAERLGQIEGRLASRSERASDMANWLEATRSDSLGSLPGRLWNKLVGAEGNASELSYEMERLRQERDRLLKLQSRVDGML